MRVTLSSQTLGSPRLNLTGVCIFVVFKCTKCLYCDINAVFLSRHPELNLMDILTTPSLVKPEKDYFRTPGQVLSLISSLGLVSGFADSYHLYVILLNNNCPALKKQTLLHAAANFFLGQKWSSVVADRQKYRTM